MKQFIKKNVNGIYTRKQARAVAKEKMKAEGLKQFCKSHRYSIITPTGQPISVRDPSKFAEKWRDYVGESIIYG